MENQFLITVRGRIPDEEGGYHETSYVFDFNFNQPLTGTEEKKLFEKLGRGLSICCQSMPKFQKPDLIGTTQNNRDQVIGFERANNNKTNSDAGISDQDQPSPGRNRSSRFHTEKSASSNSNSKPCPPATTKQVRAIQAISRMIGCEPVEFVRQSFDVKRIDQLTVSQASTVIDNLKRHQTELV